MNNFKQLRKEAGLTQVQLAEMLDVRQSTISGWETGRFMPVSIKLPVLANLLHCDIKDLLGVMDGD